MNKVWRCCRYYHLSGSCYGQAEMHRTADPAHKTGFPFPVHLGRHNLPIRKRLPSSEVDTTGKTGRTAVIVLLVWARSARCIGLNEVGGVQRRRSLDRGAVLEISTQVVFMLLLLGI